MDAQALHFVSLEGNQITFTVNNGKTPYTRSIKSDGTFSKKGCTYQALREEKVINLITEIDATGTEKPLTRALRTSPLKPLQSEFSINQRFEFLSMFTKMVIDGAMVSTIITGEGGLGKTHAVMEALKKAKKREVKDYVIVKGYATPKALYATLFENNGKIVIFDDCDSVLKDPTAVNLLKGALDSYEKRTISWLQQGFIPSELPSYFEFTGQVIFISNMNADKMDDAIKSRSICVDLSMTIQDKIERMQFILPTILPELAMEIKEAALEFMAAHSDEAREFNLRTLMKVAKVVKAYGIKNEEWKSAAKYLLVAA
jgi:hypothetical protein